MASRDGAALEERCRRSYCEGAVVSGVQGSHRRPSAGPRAEANIFSGSFFEGRRGRCAQEPRAGRADPPGERDDGPAKVSHGASEKQRRDRINSMIDQLRRLVPPGGGARGGMGSAAPGMPPPSPELCALEGKRSKYVVLAETIQLVTLLTHQVRDRGAGHPHVSVEARSSRVRRWARSPGRVHRLLLCACVSPGASRLLVARQVKEKDAELEQLRRAVRTLQHSHATSGQPPQPAPTTAWHATDPMETSLKEEMMASKVRRDYTRPRTWRSASPLAQSRFGLVVSDCWDSQRTHSSHARQGGIKDEDLHFQKRTSAHGFLGSCEPVPVSEVGIAHLVLPAAGCQCASCASWAYSDRSCSCFCRQPFVVYETSLV